MEKFEKLEKVLSELNISDKELINWVNNRCKIVANKVNTPNKNVTNLIPTELPIVYRRGTKLDIAKGLDLNYKDDVWGIQLLSGVMISLRYEHVYQKKSDIYGLSQRCVSVTDEYICRLKMSWKNIGALKKKQNLMQLLMF